MEEITKSIVYEKQKSIFVLFGDREKLNDIWDYFQNIGAAELEVFRILQGFINVYLDTDDFYKKAYSKFLIIREFDDFEKLSSEKLKEIVSGEYFQVGKLLYQECVLVDNPSKKKLIIFAGETIPNDTILENQSALETRTKIYHL